MSLEQIAFGPASDVATTGTIANKLHTYNVSAKEYQNAIVSLFSGTATYLDRVVAEYQKADEAMKATGGSNTNAIAK